MTEGFAFLFVFSTTDRKSFELITSLHSKLTKIKEGAQVASLFSVLSLNKLRSFFLILQFFQFPFVLVGNKCDLKEERQVERQEAAALARSWNCSFFETSAKEKTNNEVLHLNNCI